MKRILNILALVLSLVLVCAPLSVSAESLPEFPLSEKTTLKIFCCWSWGDVDYEVANIKEFERLTNIHLEYDAAIDAGDEKQALMMAGGDWPDLLLIGAAGGRSVGEISQSYGKQGRLANFMDYLDQMPNLKQYYEDYPDSHTLFEDDDGNVYMFPYLYPYNTVPTGFFYNKTAFDALGLGAPVTVDDVYDAAKALKQAYPDSYPLTSYTIWETMAVWGRVFGTSTGVSFDHNVGEYVFGPFGDNYREMLSYLNKLYSEELYDPEFPAYEFAGNKWREKLATGKSFMSESYVWEMQYENTNSVNTLAQKIGRGDEVDFKYVEPLTALGRRSNYWGLTTVNPSYGVVVNANSPYVEECLKLIDWQLTEPFKDLLGYGVEGVTYEVKDGKKVFLPDITISGEDEDKQLITKYISWYAGINTYEIYPDPLGWKENLENFTGYTMEEMSTFAFWADDWQMNFPQDVKDQQSQVLTAVQTLVEEKSYQIMTGSASLDDFDAFLDQLRALGIEDVVEYHNNFYNENVKK